MWFILFVLGTAFFVLGLSISSGPSKDTLLALHALGVSPDYAVGGALLVTGIHGCVYSILKWSQRGYLSIPACVFLGLGSILMFKPSWAMPLSIEDNALPLGILTALGALIFFFGPALAPPKNATEL